MPDLPANHCPDCKKKFDNNADVIDHCIKKHPNKVLNIQYPKKTKKKKRVIEQDGFLFDSQIELIRYNELVILEKAGEITNLVCNKKALRFELIPKFSRSANGVEITKRAMRITLDFMYNEPGKELPIIEEVKSKNMKINNVVWGALGEKYRMRSKLFLYKYGDQYEFREIYL